MRQKIAPLLDKLATGDGIRQTVVDGVKIMRASQPMSRKPVMYEPSIVIVGQGRKTGYLGDQVFRYDPDNYLVLSIPMPFECETDIGEDGKPMLGVSIKVDLNMLADLLMKMEHKGGPNAEQSLLGMYATPLDERLSDAVVRLLECMQSPQEARILGPQYCREIVFRVLLGEQGNALRALIAMNSRLGQIQRAVAKMHSDYDKEMDVTELAGELGMSASAFHHNFKSITATSPLQYLKTIRLHHARMFMVQEGMGVKEAAEKVGYESASQFSREFKRFFGQTPLVEANEHRQRLGLSLSEVPALATAQTNMRI